MNFYSYKTFVVFNKNVTFEIFWYLQSPLSMHKFYKKKFLLKSTKVLHMKNFWFFSSLEQVFCEIECPNFFCIRPISHDATQCCFFIYYIRLMSFAKNKIFFKTFSNIFGPGNVSCRKWLLSAFITTKRKFHFPTCTESPSLRTHGSGIDWYLISSDGSACVFWRARSDSS